MVHGWPANSLLDQQSGVVTLESAWATQAYESPYCCPIEVFDDATPHTNDAWYAVLGVSPPNIFYSPTDIWNPYLQIYRTRRRLNYWYVHSATGSQPKVFSASNNSSTQPIAWYYDRPNKRIAVVTGGDGNRTEVPPPTATWLTGTLQFTFLKVSSEPWAWSATITSDACVDMQIQDVIQCSGQLYIKPIPGTPHYIVYYPAVLGPWATGRGSYNGAGLAARVFYLDDLTLAATPFGHWGTAFDVFPTTTSPLCDFFMTGCEWDTSVLHFFGEKFQYPEAPTGNIISIVHRTWTLAGGLSTVEEIVPPNQDQVSPPDKTKWCWGGSGFKNVKWPLWDGSKLILLYHGGDTTNTFAGAGDTGIMQGNTGAWTFDVHSLSNAIQDIQCTDDSGTPSYFARYTVRQVYTGCVSNGELYVIMGLTPIASNYWYDYDSLYWTRRDATTGKWDAVRRLLYIVEGRGGGIGGWSVTMCFYACGGGFGQSHG